MLNTIARLFRKMNKAHYNYLLILLIILFIFRPYDQGFTYLAIWKSFFACTILTAIFNCKHHLRVKVAAISAAIPTFVLGWVELYHSSQLIFVIHIFFILCFLWVCTTSIIYDVILHAKVTIETLRGVVCAYFMIAFVFAYMYYLIEYLMPGSFQLIHRDVSFVTYSNNLAELMYFSFVTLLTIGFGDITPLGDVAQTVVIMEGIIGQFYIAILVARIVSVYAFFNDARLLQKALEGTKWRRRK